MLIKFSQIHILQAFISKKVKEAMPKQISPFESQHHKSYVVDLPIHLFLATHDKKCIHISVMISIVAKLSIKSIAHSKSCITYILFVTMLSLVKATARVKGQIEDVVQKLQYLYHKSVRNRKSNLEDSMWKSFIHYISIYIYISLSTQRMNIGIWKDQHTYL